MLYKFHDSQPRRYINHENISWYKNHLISPHNQYMAIKIISPSLLSSFSISIWHYLRRSAAKSKHESSFGPISLLYKSHGSQQAHQ